MQHTTESSVFKPKPSRQETKTDATTRAVREILAKEEAARVAKTERLRMERLAREATEEPAPVKSVKKKTRKKS